MRGKWKHKQILVGGGGRLGYQCMRVKDLSVGADFGAYMVCVRAAFHEKEHLRTIYSPLTEALLALYLGAEWVLVSGKTGVGVLHHVESPIPIS